MSGLYAAGLAVIIGGGMLTGKGPAGSLKAKPTTPLAPPVMPDQNQVQQATQLKEAQASALRQGRASTILTSNANTGDKLGP